MCSYEGVTCTADDANMNEGVEEINLAGFGLISNITTQIYQLPFLKKVDFSNNVVDLSFDGIEDAIKLEVILMSDADLKTVYGISGALSLTKVSRTLFRGYLWLRLDLFDLILLCSCHTIYTTAAHCTQQFSRG